jgi:osmoprotectant transport system ATP-binding protein
VIQVKNLTKYYNNCSTPAVDNISFHIKKGDIACLIGTSGCGKTTSLKMLNKLVIPSSGEIKINNIAHSALNELQLRRSIGYVIQKSGLFPHLTTFENISLLSCILKRNKKDIDNRVKELLEIVRLDFNEVKNKFPCELSGGQQQRVGIARSLMEDPPVLLMDEPFGALDPITRESMHDEFYNLNQKLGKTILIVTHDLSEAFKLGDQIILMNNGHIIQAGTKEDFYSNPKSKFVEDFLHGTNHV